MVFSAPLFRFSSPSDPAAPLRFLPVALGVSPAWYNSRRPAAILIFIAWSMYWVVVMMMMVRSS